MSSKSPAATPLQPPRLWIARPWVDCSIGCGGWSLPLLAVSYALSRDSAREWAGAFYALALVANYPHYMATVYRAYGVADRARIGSTRSTARRPRRARPAGARRAVAPARPVHRLRDVEPVALHRAELGLLMMFVRRAGLPASPAQARRLKLAFAASFVMLLAAFNEGPSSDPTVLSLGLPQAVTRVVGWAAASAFIGLGVTTLWPVVRRAGVAARGADSALHHAGPVVRGADRAVVDHRTGHAADPLQLGHPRGDAFGAVPVDYPVFRHSAIRATGGGAGATGPR